jgi:hypothetical protein
VLEQRFHHLGQSGFDPLGARNHERPCAAGELRIEQQERQAGEMVAVEMGDQDQVDCVSVNAEALQRG